MRVRGILTQGRPAARRWPCGPLEVNVCGGIVLKVEPVQLRTGRANSSCERGTQTARHPLLKSSLLNLDRMIKSVKSLEML